MANVYKQQSKFNWSVKLWQLFGKSYECFANIYHPSVWLRY